MQGNRGFTLVELLIVIALIGIVATIALPNLISARLSANETAAIGTLRKLISAQAQFQKRGIADEDRDGLGECGTFAEMAGSMPVRGTATMAPTVFNASFRTINTNGEVASSGYQFRIFLPNAAGEGLGELPGGGPPPGVDADLAETTWCVYAWPTQYEESGVRTFFVNQGGELIFTASAAYSGPASGPVPGAALRAGGVANSITGQLATAATGRDGNFWRSVGN